MATLNLFPLVSEDKKHFGIILSSTIFWKDKIEQTIHILQRFSNVYHFNNVYNLSSMKQLKLHASWKQKCGVDEIGSDHPGSTHTFIYLLFYWNVNNS